MGAELARDKYTAHAGRSKCPYRDQALLPPDWVSNQNEVMAQHWQSTLRQLRTFKTHVRIFGSEIAIFCGLAPAGSKPRVFPTLNLVLRTER